MFYENFKNSICEQIVYEELNFIILYAHNYFEPLLHSIKLCTLIKKNVNLVDKFFFKWSFRDCKNFILI